MLKRNDANILECANITVKFGDTIALDDVSVAFERGKIHVVAGQNGAGKTTFARVAAGMVSPDKGEMVIEGHPIGQGDVSLARRAGVELVHQSFALPPSFSVAEAMQFGAPGGRIFSRRGLEKTWQPHLDELDVKVSAHQRIRDLPVETQQGVEIARALVTEAKLLILDEPTAVLSPKSIEKLFERVRRLKQMGVTVVLILHKIREVLDIAETVTVLRGGRLVWCLADCSGLDAQTLSDLIIGSGANGGKHHDETEAGEQIAGGQGRSAGASQGAGVKLNFEAVSTRPDRDGPALVDVDLKIHSGEIVGVAGIEGNGQRTLVRAIADLADLSRGRVSIDGHDVTGVTHIERRGRGLRIIPFERNVEGLSLTSALWENWFLRQFLQGPIYAMISPRDARAQCMKSLDQWNVHYADVDQMAGSLSGGNAQKLILSREMDPEATLIVAAQPTRGLDVGATEFVWEALRAARNRGCGVLFISSDLDELFELSDRVIVLLAGKLVGQFTAPFDFSEIGAAMTGAGL